MASRGTKGRGENGLLLDPTVAGREQWDKRVALQMGAVIKAREKKRWGEGGRERVFLFYCSSEQDSDFPI